MEKPLPMLHTSHCHWLFGVTQPKTRFQVYKPKLVCRNQSSSFLNRSLQTEGLLHVSNQNQILSHITGHVNIQILFQMFVFSYLEL